VEARLFARDGAEQEGKSEGAFLVLPERRFSHPVAQQLVALRRALSLDPSAREPARRELDRITNAPEAFEHDTGMFLTLRTARHRLIRDRRDEAVPEVQQILWDIAVALEEGRTDRSARALAQAREALREALEEARRENAEANPERSPEERAEQRAEMQRRIQELREAIRRHLEALAERMQRENNEALAYDPQQRVFDRRELERRTRRLEDAARDGRQEDAEREMAELEEMLQALEEGRTSRAEDRQRQQRQRGQQQMGALQDMVRRETEMLDRAHRRSGDQENTRNDARRPPPPRPQTPEAREEAARDARTQRALRRALGELMQQVGELTGDVPAPLGEADRAMRDAAEALGEGRDPRGAQQQAIRALTEGGRQMSQRMQRQFGPPQPGEGEGEGEGQGMAGGQQGGEGQGQEAQRGEGRDPLGRDRRETGGSAQDNAGDTLVPGEAERLRSHQLQQELRRRGAERERTPVELDYIDRLLRRF
jgi:DNA repair exonuclease SbcCD ATPase subunit